MTRTSRWILGAHATVACLASAAWAHPATWGLPVWLVVLVLLAAAFGFWRGIMRLRANGPPAAGAVPIHVGDQDVDNTVEELLRHTERLKLRHFRTRRTAHSLTSLLSAACTNVDILGTMGELEVDNPQVQACLARLEKALEGSLALMDDFSGASAAAAFQPVRLDRMVRSLESLRHIPSLENCDLSLDPGRRVPPIHGDESQLRLMILGLTLASARSYPEACGPIRVRCCEVVVEREHLDEAMFGDQLTPSAVACVEVEDRGAGPAGGGEPVHDLAALLELMPEPRRVGVEVAAAIVRDHFGAMRVVQDGEGVVRVTAWFPLMTRHEPLTDAPLGEVLTRANDILVIDDQPEVLEATRVILEREGLVVRTAQSGPEALEMLDDPDVAIGLVLLDVVMPGMDGVATYRRLRERRADLPIILASGMPESEVIQRMGGVRPTGYLGKPYRQNEIVEYLRMFMG